MGLLTDHHQMNSCLLAICLSVLTVVSSSPTSQPCLGCPQKVDTLSLQDKEIVEFGTWKLRLANDGLLAREFCDIEYVAGTFTSQGVAGTNFRFDLKIQNYPSSWTCRTAPETCHMVVFKPLPSDENQDLQVRGECTRVPVRSN